MTKPPHNEVAGIFPILVGVHSLWHEGDEALEVELQRRTAAVEEGWRPWDGVWIHAGDDYAQVAVWETNPRDDRVTDADVRWIERKFRKCVAHLEHYLGPAELRDDERLGPSELEAGGFACAVWAHDTARLCVYLQHEDSDLPIILFVRVDGPRPGRPHA